MEEKQPTKNIVLRIIEFFMASIVAAFIIVFMILSVKNRVMFSVDISADGSPVEIQNVIYRIDNHQNVTEYHVAEYAERNGIVTIMNEEELEGGTAFAVYTYKIYFLADGEEFEADFDLLRTNGKKNPFWKVDVEMQLTKQDGIWNVMVSCDDCEGVQLINGENIPSAPIKVEILERFGSLE